MIISSSKVLDLLIEDELVRQFGIGGCAPIGAFPILDLEIGIDKDAMFPCTEQVDA